MIIGGQKIEAELEDIPVAKLEPDLDQPRRYEIQIEQESKGGDGSQARKPDGIQLATRFKEMVNAVIENQGISIPLVVQPHNGGKFKVIDGDRRLGAVNYILNDDTILKEHPELKKMLATLPCMVLKEKLDREQLLRLLIQIHVHLAAWTPIAKDKAVLDITTMAKDPERAAALTGMSKGNVRKTIEINEMAKNFDFKGPQRISYAREVVNLNKSLKDPEVVEKIIEKSKDKQIKTAVDIRKLRQILPDPEAREKFLESKSTIDDAVDVLRAKEFKKSLEGPSLEFQDLLDRLTASMKAVKFEDLLKYKGNPEVKKMVDENIKLLNNFKTYIQA